MTSNTISVLSAIGIFFAFTFSLLAIPGDLESKPAVPQRFAETANTITVTNTNDNGAGSLRQAIAGAAPGDTINSSVSGAINLTSGTLVIDKNLTIQGPGANLLSISGNHASTVFHITHGGINARVDGLTIRNGLGDGIINRGTLTVSNSIITQNGASGISGNGSITVINSTISGNAHSGINADAGCYFPPYLSVSNSTISGNGGIGVGNIDGTAEIANSTIVGNRGGIVSADDCHGDGGTTKLWNTLVAGNMLSPPGPYGLFGTDIFGKGIAVASHNLIGDANYSGGIQNGVNGNIVGVSPLLGPLRNNGGPTMTHALLPGSPAINAGDNCVLTENGCGIGNPALPTDQRGLPRNGTVDIGAFERQPNEPSTSAPFDYDGDGKSDYSVYRPADATWHLAYSGDGTYHVRPFGFPGQIWIVPADYDGDGITDIADIRCCSDFDLGQLGAWVIWNSFTNTTSGRERYFEGNERAVPADYDGDGKADMAYWNSSNGIWQIFLSESGWERNQQWGLPGDKPVPADFDGDGRSELVVWRPSEGRWYVLNLVNGGFGYLDWGLPGDIPIAGDFSGDGRADFGVYRPSDNTWHRLHTDDFSIAARQWGLPGDIPTPGDYDGDGRLDLAVYRPSENRWYALTHDGQILSQQFGLDGDIPTESAYMH